MEAKTSNTSAFNYIDENFAFENMERIRRGEAPQAVVKNFDSM